MAKYKISWSIEAEIDLSGILEFNIQRIIVVRSCKLRTTYKLN